MTIHYSLCESCRRILEKQLAGEEVSPLQKFIMFSHMKHCDECTKLYKSSLYFKPMNKEDKNTRPN